MSETDAATCTTIDTKDNPTDDGKSNMNQNQNQPKSRKARWKPALMKQEHDYWKHSTNSGLSLENNENITHKHTSNWLETHLWHAKRFIMSPSLSIFNNWCIPLTHANRGSRAALRLAKTKATVQDATWTMGGRVLVLESTTTKEALILATWRKYVVEKNTNQLLF